MSAPWKETRGGFPLFDAGLVVTADPTGSKTFALYDCVGPVPDENFTQDMWSP